MRAVWLVGIAVAGCSTYDGEAPLGPDVSSGIEYKDIPIVTPTRLDVLFVIDDSPAMAPFEATLRANLPQLIAVVTADEGVPRVHVGVIAGAAAERGDLHRAARVRGPFLVEDGGVNGAAVHNYTGAIDDAFVELASVGSQGAATQQPLAMALRALHDPRNVGFLRADADLALIFITAQDDQSPQSTSELAAELVALKADPERIIVAGIAGPADGGCTYNGATAAASSRLSAFLDAFANRSEHVSICQADLTAGLRLVVSQSGPLGTACLDRTPRQLPDGQYDCSVSDVQDPGTSQQAEQILPACSFGAGGLPCWRIVSDPADCSPNGIALAIARAGYAPENDHVIANCVVE